MTLLGYGVVEFNQASGIAECFADDTLHLSEGDAVTTAESFKADAEARGRGEKYAVVECRRVWPQ